MIDLRNDLDGRVTEAYWSILTLSRDIAENDFKVKFIPTEFLVLALIKSNTDCGELLRRFGVTAAMYRDKVLNDFKNSNSVNFTSNAKLVINRSAEKADQMNMKFLAPEHLLYAVMTTKCMGREYLRDCCNYYDQLFDALENVFDCWKKRKSQPIDDPRGARTSSPATDNAYRVVTSGFQSPSKESAVSVEENFPSIAGTVLEKFGYDMTDKARRGKIDPVIGRTKEMERIINILSRRQKNNPLVIGEPGIGKTAVVEGLARKIASGDVPLTLRNKIIYSFDLSSVVAGAKMRGEFEQRFKQTIEYIQNNENIILFIDEIHNLVTGGKSDGVDASEILKPALARGEMQVIGATTIDEYRKYIEKDPALERRFQPIMVDPPTTEQTIEILMGLKDTFEAHHQVEITREAIQAAVDLSDRYINDRFLPDKAIDLIDEAAAHARIVADAPDKELNEKSRERRKLLQEIDYARAAGRDYSAIYSRLTKITAEIEVLSREAEKQNLRKRPFIDAEDIAKVISELTGIPVTRLSEDEKQKLAGLEKTLMERVIGQDNAVSAVSHAIRRAMTGVNDPDKPIGTFLFVGPTGVGKTELAKALAETLFGDENFLIRIDMSEYKESSSIAKLIGAPPGYVGYDEEGQLTEKVRRKPYSVVLFDEVEKAHGDIFNLFLQIFDDGRLTDNKGRLVDFKNTIIILTSNAGFDGAVNFDQSPAARQEKITAALKKKFRPEFLNRIDETVVFNFLGKKDCREICDLLLDGLAKRLALIDITFSCGQDVADLILSEGYSAEYGGRNLKRAVRDVLEDAISEKLIEGTIKHGDSVTAFVNDYGYIDFSVSR